MSAGAGGKNVQGFVGFAMVAGAASLWGCWALFLRPAAVAGVACAFILFLVMTLPAPLALWRGRKGGDRGATVALVILGIADGCNVGLVFEAMQRGPIPVAMLTHYLAPLLVALVAPWVTGERRSRRALLAVPFSLLGLLLLIGMPGEAGFSPVTAALGTGSALFYAIVIFASKRAARAYSALAVVALHAPISALVLVAFSGGGVLPAPGTAWGWVVAGSLVCGLTGAVIFNAGLRRVPAQAAGMLTYLEPVVASGVGWAFYGERLGLRGIVGALLVLACGAWVVGEPEPAPEAAPVLPAPRAG